MADTKAAASPKMQVGGTVYMTKSDAKHRKFGVIKGASDKPGCDWVVVYETGHTREHPESVLTLQRPTK